ncbi:protein MEI2-like 2 isoform X2 [Punica granatum]|nr:protein MEI2-like 2 isoform X2 [Punica granatum]XP_031380736.1 protein MEI2-like 2 isoform X2 [Punica granatum]XP_031380737.1 protein MEI2-like 2 isoform X2 [Punica granatum]XP_031380739.1 protein MEI2-like 2 isoform X2 [Punica granatum]
MEQRRKDLVSGFSEGPFKAPSVNIPGNARSGAWGIPPGGGGYHGSDDTSLFSSSLPVLPHEKLNFTESEQHVRSIDDNFSNSSKLNQDDEGRDPLEDIEPTGIGSLLPDEDDLLAGLMDDLDLTGLPVQLEELEEYDIFGSGGGMELDADPQESLSIGLAKVGISDGIAANGIGHYAFPNGMGTVAGEHPYGEHPSRTLFVRNINSNVEDSELRSLFEQYGDIRTLYTACKHRGFVMISYYDIRDARTAMRTLQNKPLRRRKLDIHFSIPKDNPSEKDINQGTLVVFNLDASVSNDDLRQIFGSYGEVKEIRETPHKKHHKFIEFFDVRAAEAALRALNRSDIAGKRIKVEPSRPGGARRNLMQQLNQELEQDEARSFRHHVGSPITSSPPGAWTQFGSPVEQSPLLAFSKSPGLGPLSPVGSNPMPGLASILPPHISGSPKIAPIGKDQGRLNHVNQIFDKTLPAMGSAYSNSQSLSEQSLSASPGPISPLGESNPKSTGIATLTGPQFLWGSPPAYSEHASSAAWPVSSARHLPGSSGQSRGQGFPFANRHTSLLSSHQPHQVGSAPSGVPFDRRFGFFPESPESSFMNSMAIGGLGLNRNKGNYVMNMGIPGSITDNGSPNFRMMPMPRHSPMILGNGSFPGPGAIGIEGLGERGRNRRVDTGGAQLDSKKQYQLDLDKIMNGEDTRTTLMIKNIPNKYTSKMLLAAIDENHRGTYDFLYLPIDFKNKCNVGYAFINMVSPSHIVSFYKTFNGKKWEKFNSEKVASLAYARIQGKAALVTHFQNSSLMNEDKRCRPILFHSEGQDAGDKDYLLSGNLNICIRQADGSYIGDSLDSPRDGLSEKPEDY